MHEWSEIAHKLTVFEKSDGEMCMCYMKGHVGEKWRCRGRVLSLPPFFSLQERRLKADSELYLGKFSAQQQILLRVEVCREMSA